MTADLNQTAEMAAKFQLKEEVVKRYKIVFDDYDKEQDGLVQVKDLPAIFKTLRGTITETEGSARVTQSTQSSATRSSNRKTSLRATS